MSRGRRWLFWFITVVVVPACLLLVLEVALRLLGIGFSTRYFQPVPDRSDALMGNPRFGWSYFPPAIARMPEPFVMHGTKKPGTIRIFVIGSSAALGFPMPAFSFSRILEVMLRERFPALEFEVINTSIVAINSHVCVAIAEDASREHGDLYIVYEGNNEVVGPWGPGTVFAGFSPNRTAIRAMLALRSLRIAQVLDSALSMVRGAGTITEWTGMELFLDRKIAADDERLAGTVEHFRANLLAICDAVRRGAEAPLVLCTVGVNLLDCPPFASLHRPGLTAEEQGRWEQSFARAVALQESGDAKAALAEFAVAEAIDDRYAELEFRSAQCLLALGRDPEASRRFERARDLDALRFRTSAALNEVVRSVAAERSDGVVLVDVERLMAAPEHSPHGIPGESLFYEHCHMTFEGNYLIASALFDAAVRAVPELKSGAEGAVPPSLEACASLLGWNARAKAEVLRSLTTLIARPPFTYQIGHEQAMRRIDEQVAALAEASTPAAMQTWRTEFEAAIRKAPRDWILRREFGTLLVQLGDLEEAEAQLRRALEIVPFDYESSQGLAGVLAKRGRLDQAIEEYERAMASPRIGRLERANLLFSMGVIEQRRGTTDAAADRYEQALVNDPREVRAWTNLGLLRFKQRRFDEAESSLRRVIELAPELPSAHVNMAMLREGQGRVDEAIAELKQALALQPGMLGQWVTLATLQQRLGRHAESIDSIRQALALAPQNVDLQVQLGIAYAKTNDIDAAERQFISVLQAVPNHPVATKALDAIRAHRAGAPK